jgi:hypothetical protein
MANTFLSPKGPITAHVWEVDEAGNEIGAELGPSMYTLALSNQTGATETFSGNVLTPASVTDVASMDVTATEIAPGPNPGLVSPATNLSLIDQASGLVVKFSQP